MNDGGFTIGVGSSLCAAVVGWAIAKRQELSEFSKGHRKSQHLKGAWKQYHFSFDSKAGSVPILVTHNEIWEATWDGRLKGASDNDYSTRISYKLDGSFHHDRLILRYQNCQSPECVTFVFVDNALSGNLLVGIWVGRDFNQHMTTGVIIYSRDPITPENALRISREHAVHFALPL